MYQDVRELLNGSITREISSNVFLLDSVRNGFLHISRASRVRVPGNQTDKVFKNVSKFYSSNDIAKAIELFESFRVKQNVYYS